MNADEIREWATKILGKVAAKRLDELVVDVLAMQPAPIGSVDIIGGRIGIETIEVAGIEIELDANGNASRVNFPYGAEVFEVAE